MPKRKTFAERTKSPTPEPATSARAGRTQWSTLMRPDLAQKLMMKAASESMRTGKRASIADLVERFVEDGLGRMK